MNNNTASPKRGLTIFGTYYVFNSSTDAAKALALREACKEKTAAELEHRMRLWGVDYRVEIPPNRANYVFD